MHPPCPPTDPPTAPRRSDAGHIAQVLCLLQRGGIQGAHRSVHVGDGRRSADLLPHQALKLPDLCGQEVQRLGVGAHDRVRFAAGDITAAERATVRGSQCPTPKGWGAPLHAGEYMRIRRKAPPYIRGLMRRYSARLLHLQCL